MNRPPQSARRQEPDDPLPDLRELCRIHDVSLEMIESSDDLNALLMRILDEYEQRLSDLPNEVLDGRVSEAGLEGRKKLRALLMFAGQASALKTKAEAAEELRRHAGQVQQANARLEAALGQAEHNRRRLDGVIAALNAGMLIVDAEGKIEQANPAAASLTGRDEAALVGRNVAEVVGMVPRRSDGEIALSGEGGRRVLLVARRDLADQQGEVVLLSDITERDREMEERHRLEKFAGLLRTVGVLSHKINNPLTALLGRAQLLQARKGSDPDVLKSATVIEESAKRIADLLRELATVVKERREAALEGLLDIGPAPLDPEREG